MNIELIDKVQILESGALAIILESGGRPDYQLIYREAAEVSWDNDLKAFKSPIPRKWSHSDWYFHIVKIAGNCEIILKRTDITEWVNVPPQVREEICAKST